jgi:RNA-binding protein NOB1
MTTDYAMQNVILQMNLNLISPSLHRVKHIKTFILRCHGKFDFLSPSKQFSSYIACFLQVRDLEKQFCPRCGKDTLTRVTCTTSQNGEFKIHLKKNMQWNNRGNRFSVPKPVHGAANFRVQGGGKGGWGNDLILSEDQKEYVKGLTEEKRAKKRDMMDPDNSPDFLTGNRHKAGGKVKVGAGRHVNSRKR